MNNGETNAIQTSGLNKLKDRNSYDQIIMQPKKTIYNSGKILIVDDERFNCEIIDGFLMVLNFENKNERREFAYNGE